MPWTAARHARRGRSPGSSPRRTSAGPGARRTGRRACRCPSRTRWSRPSRCRPRAGTCSGSAPAPAGRGPRGTAAPARRGRPGTARSARPSSATGSRRCPASPSCSVRRRLSSWSRGLSLGAIRYWMLGRSKLATKCLASRRLQPLRDLRVRLLGGGGRQRDPGDLGPALVQHRQLQVVGPEVVPPLRHAVRLVDGEQGDGAAVQQLDGLAAPAGARAPGTAGPARRAR